MRIHWFEFTCNIQRGDSYTNAPGLVTCKPCLRKLAKAAKVKGHKAEKKFEEEVDDVA